jgi:type IV secretory pathway VirB10-like protein
MPIVRYIVWVGTSLLALLFVANWFLPKPPQEAAHEAVNAPVIRIASVQQPPEAVVIDTNQPTIIPPSIAPESAVPDAPSPLQSYASVEPPPATIDVGQKKRKESKRQKAKVAAYQSTSVHAHAVAANGSPPTVPPTKLSFLEIVSGMGKRLFNLRWTLRLLEDTLSFLGSRRRSEEDEVPSVGSCALVKMSRFQLRFTWQ